MKKKNTDTQTGRAAYSYLRFSTPEQAKGDSHRRQSERPEGVCQEFGWVLQAKTYQDCGVSARHGRNRKKGDLSVFLAALAASELEPNPVLILEDLDRLSRDKIQPSMDCARDILKTGCDIYSIIERKLYTRDHLEDPMGLMGLIWRFYLAREESEKKAHRSRENWGEKHRHAKQDGAIFSRICPGWLTVVGGEYDKEGRLEGGRFEVVPEKVEVVKNLFRWCIEGSGTLIIMRKLAAENVPPFRSGWSQKTIWEILRDRRVLGDLPTTLYGDEKKPGETITGYYPAVIDQRTFDRAQDAIKSRTGRTGRKGDYINLFTGLVRYPKHDSTMVFLSKPKRNKSGLHQYRYLASYQSWKGRYPYVAVRYDRFEEVVLRWLYDIAGELIPRAADDDGVASLKARRASLERSIKDTADELEKAGVSVPSVIAKLIEMEAEKTALTRQIDEKQQHATRPSIDETKALIELLKTTTGAELKALREHIRQRLLLHIDRIDVEVRTLNGSREMRGDWAYLTITMSSGLVRKVMYELNGVGFGIWDNQNPDDHAHFDTMELF